MPVEKRHAEIAGAGFAGLAMAIALCHRGWSVRVHEANTELREVGAGIFIWDNGLLTLGALGVRDDVLDSAHAAPASEVRVDGVRRSLQVTNSAGSYPMLTMTRQSLYGALLKAAHKAGAEFLTDSKAAGANPNGELLMADGRRFKADLVVATDGAGSSVREALKIGKVRKSYENGITRVLTSREGFRGGDWDNVIDFWTHEPVTRRILYTPCGDDIAYLAMMTSSADGAGSAVPVDSRLWCKAFPQLSALIAEIGARGRHDGYASVRVANWFSGRVALVGDSANAMPPTLGQGAGIAMMNALSLAAALDGTSTVEDGLAIWESRERPFTELTQARAEELAAMGAKRSELAKGEVGLHGARNVPTGSTHPAPADLAQAPASIRDAPWYQAAWALVLQRHGGKRDPLGRPTEEHFVRVANRLIGRFAQATPVQVQAALLHDAFEPGGFSENQLRDSGIAHEAIGLIRQITLPADGRSYLQYSQDLAANGDVAAIQVKLADNADAFELFAAIGTPEALSRLESQYKPSRAALQAGLPAWQRSP